MRVQRTLLLAALAGTLTGFGVAAFEWSTREQLFATLIEAPLYIQAIALPVGLLLSWLALRLVGMGATPATADEYIANFHDRHRPLKLGRTAIAKLLAGATTLGTGGALGYEGPSLYLGAATGAAIQARRPRWFARADSKVLMVAGAAAGVAAIFKAPATGAMFALEVPYRDDTARHLLLPALVGSASGYLTFVAIAGTEPLFDVAGSPPFDLKELGGAALLGLACGLGARGFAMMVARAKTIAASNSWMRPAAAGAVLIALLLASDHLFGSGLSTGSGYRTLEWVTEPGHGLGLVIALLAFRVTATAATLAGGGVGGLFIPLVIAGALLGDAAAIAVGDTTNLFPLIGVAAFLGAGYRTPLAGVVFVAETTGRPGFIVPGLIASVVAQLVMGDASVSPYQQAGGRGHLERRFLLPISTVIRGDVLTVPPDASLREFYDHHLLMTRETSVPVLDRGRYLGVVSSDALRSHPPEDWKEVTVGDIVDHDWPTAQIDATLEVALRTMDNADVDMLPVLDDDGAFVGTVSSVEIVRLDEILGPGGNEA